MNPLCKPVEHINRRAFLKGTLATAAGGAFLNFGSLFNSDSIAAEAKKLGKKCILLWMNGGASQIDTFDMKPGTDNAGPFRPINTKVSGMPVCEYLPKVAQHADKLAVIRSMKTSEPDHPGGIMSMHTGYRPAVNVPYPEIGAMVAKFNGPADSDLPSCVHLGGAGYGGGGGAGFLGPKFQPFSVGRDGRLPSFTTPYLKADSEQRRNDLLRFMEQDAAKESSAEPFEAHRLAKEKAWRLLQAKGVFDASQEWPKYRDLYGDTEFGRGCMMARRLIEAGVAFVEVGQENYDSHADNFTVHKATLSVLDPGWSGLMTDLKDRGLLDDTLIIWMGEVGRTPQINNRVGRDHYINGWTVVLAGGGTKGGMVYGATNANGVGVKDDPVSEGDLFATIFTALGINPRAKHYVGPRPITAAPEKSKVVKEVLA
ncbi:MAG: DUF1501 domain-containing protein [Gemmataceae bacterium]|nr:DUF1501 domain-containing protein [Gemmataceae bacterium]